MGLIPEDVISEIRARADIVAVIGRHVQLRKAGRSHKGLCPFHSEKSPSFNVNHERGFYYCFGCQKKGDVISFVMEYEGKSFAEALESLAALTGITLPERDESPGARAARGERPQMLEVNRAATELYRSLLADPQRGAPARAYLAQRGIGDEITERFQLGWAPPEWRALADHLAAGPTSMDAALKAGLVARQPRGNGYYDRFRDRLMCPVIVPGGEVAGFSGRLVGSDPRPPDEQGEAPKYLNSPESLVYKKSRLLFGLHQARESFRSKGRAILVEGNFDVVALHQAGFTETVAPLGTALTPEQVDLLRRLADSVVLLYDGDKAGRAATLRSLETLVAADVPVRIARLPDGQDPDSLVRGAGPAALAALLDKSQPGIEYFCYEVWSQHAASADGRAKALAEAAQVVANVANPTKRDLIIGTLATAMAVDPGVVRRALARPTGGSQPGPPNPPVEPPAAPQVPAGPFPMHEVQVVTLLANHPQLMEIAAARGLDSLLTDARLRDMYSAARAGRPLAELVVERLPPELAKDVISPPIILKDPARELEQAIEGLERHHKLVHRIEERRRIADAGRRGDSASVREIVTTRKQVD